MNVYEIKLKLYLLQDIKVEDTATIISALIDQALAKEEELLELHDSNCFKNYVFNSLYPLEADKLYKKDNIYTLTIRTINQKLANFFSHNLSNEYSNSMKALTSEIRIIPRKMIEKLYSITPVIVKHDHGYWRKNMSFEEYENRLKTNLIKKYNAAMNTKIEEDFQLYTSIEFLNKKPIAVKYKNIKLLGDKICLNVNTDKKVQEIAYLSLGVGFLEMNARGQGFVNYRWL